MVCHFAILNVPYTVNAKLKSDLKKKIIVKKSKSQYQSEIIEVRLFLIIVQPEAVGYLFSISLFAFLLTSCDAHRHTLYYFVYILFNQYIILSGLSKSVCVQIGLKVLWTTVY